MKEYNYIKNIENNIDPIDVGTIHFIQSYTKILSPQLQYKIMESGAKKNPYMSFVVEPYSLFIFYELKDLDWAQKLIPDNFELIKTKVFDDDTPKYQCVFGLFNVHTSSFWGSRLEFYIIAKNKETNLHSWIIVDYDTNTISYDAKNGLTDGNTDKCIFTTTYDGRILFDLQNKKDNRIINGDCSVTDCKFKALDPDLWLLGNLSIAYGKSIGNNSKKTFSTIFNPQEVDKSFIIPLENINIDMNTWYPGLFKETPNTISCFPYAQHYLSDSPGFYSNIKNKDELLKKIDSIDFDSLPKYSAKPLRTSFKIGQISSILLIIFLAILLIIKW